MSEVHHEAQEQEAEAALALLPFEAGRQTVPGFRVAHTEMLDSLITLERQPGAGNEDSLIVLLGSICMREIKHILPEGYY